MHRRSSLRLALLALLLIVLARPASAVAEDPPFVGWTALLPTLSLPYDATSPDDCIAGRAQCVDKVIRQMSRQLEPLASACDHDAIFSLTYLRVTQEYRRTIDTPYFDDTPFVNHEDVIFAGYYFSAFDAWQAGRTANVPPAWRVAFDAASDQAVSANGNLLLGINAHVQRDLPFVLYSVGLVKPDGTSRKPDHDRVDQILNRVTDDLVAEIARRFDPTIDDTNLPTTLDDFALFQLLAGWRETAWRHAELLAQAPTPEAREAVALEIEGYAASQARSIRAATQYPPLIGGRAARDAFCATHWANNQCPAEGHERALVAQGARRTRAPRNLCLELGAPLPREGAVGQHGDFLSQPPVAGDPHRAGELLAASEQPEVGVGRCRSEVLRLGAAGA